MRTKNRHPLLERALKSVINQTFTDWFLVVVNSGDPVPVERLVRRYHDQLNGRVALLHVDESLGVAAAANLGIEHGDSKYLVFHDDGDTWAPNFLLMSVNQLEHAREGLPSVRGVVSQCLRLREHLDRDTIVTDGMMQLPALADEGGILSLYCMAKGNAFTPIAFMYERAALDSIEGPYREDLPVLSDWEFNLRFMSHFDILVLPYALAFSHVLISAHGDSEQSPETDHQDEKRYEQLIRNNMLRTSTLGEPSRLGLLVNLAPELREMRHGTHTGQSSVPDSSATTPVDEKSGLAGKFWRHWRQEGPQRAMKVLARHMYLTLGGKR